jgi:two-component system, chemotaxis family, chemotaxis protein CheY
MKVLLIDDSSLSRTILKRSLGGQHQFLEAEDGIRGLEMFFVENPDLVFLDLTMPGMNGLEILQQLRQMNQEVPIIIGTADIQEMTRQEANDLGASAYLNKPFTTENVLEVVEKVTGSIRD